MTPEELIKRHEESQQRLREDIQWLRDAKFEMTGATTEDLIRESERIIDMHTSLIDRIKSRP